jgi:O-antigen/teichoic acid export membrane protein
MEGAAPDGSTPVRDRPHVLSLRINFAWTFVGNMIFNVAQWLMLAVLAKIVAPEVVGEFVLATAVSAPILGFLQLQLRDLQITDVANEYGFGHYLGLRLFTMLLGCVASAGVGLLWFSPYLTLLITLMAVNTAVTAVRDVYQSQMQKHERMDYISVARMVTGVLSLVAFGATLLATKSLAAGIVANIVVKVGMLFAYDQVKAARLLDGPTETSGRGLRPSFEPGRLFRLTVQALPLGIVMGILTVTSNVPRYFLESAHGVKELGFFGAVATLGQAIMLVNQALGQSAASRLAKYFANNLPAFKVLVVKLLIVGALLGVAGTAGAALLGEPILTIAYKAEYAQYNRALVITMAMCGVTCMASFLGYALLAARRFKILIPLSAVVLGVTTLASWLLVGPYGVDGTAWAVMCGMIAQLIVQGWVVWRAVAAKARQDAVASGPAPGSAL